MTWRFLGNYMAILQQLRWRPDDVRDRVLDVRRFLKLSQTLFLLLVWIGPREWSLIAGLHAQSLDPASNCTLHGRVGAKFPDGQFVPAKTAEVYVLFASEYVDRGTRDKFFTHRRTVTRSAASSTIATMYYLTTIVNSRRKKSSPRQTSVR